MQADCNTYLGTMLTSIKDIVRRFFQIRQALPHPLCGNNYGTGNAVETWTLGIMSVCRLQ